MNDDFFDFDLKYLISLILEKLWLLCLCILGFLFLAVAFIALSARIYTSTATIEVPQQAQRVLAMEGVTDQDFRSSEILNTIESNLQRMSLYQRVMQSDPVREKWEQIFAGSELNPEKASPQRLAGFLKKRSDANLVRATRLIEVSVEHTDPEMAALLVNQTVKEYIREMIGTRSGSSRNAFQFLMDEAQNIRRKLQDSESKVQDFERAVDLREQIEEASKTVSELEQRYRDKHPKLIQARSLRSSLEKQFQRELLSIIKSDETDYLGEDQLKRLQGLTGDERVQEQLKMMEAKFNVLNREVESDRILYESLVTRMKETGVAEGVEAEPVELVEPGMVPSQPSKPQKLLILAIALFLGSGTGLGAIFVANMLDSSLKTVDQAERESGLAILAAIPDDKRLPDALWMKQKGKRILDDLVSRSQADSGSAPAEKVSRKQSSDSAKTKIEPLVLLSDPSGQGAEAIRSLRASVKLLGPEKDKKVILVTSAAPGEGKSFVSSNLSLSMAQEGKRVLIIDADLRRPMIDKIFNINKKKSAGGLAQYLSGILPLADCIQPTGIQGLDVITVGANVPNPAELLAGKLIQSGLTSLAEDYDRIIMDTAPVNAVADTLLILDKVDCVLLVSQAAKTPRAGILRAIRQLQKGGKGPDGLVLNRLPARPGLGNDPYYYYYGSDDSYGNSYGAS